MPARTTRTFRSPRDWCPSICGITSRPSIRSLARLTISPTKALDLSRSVTACSMAGCAGFERPSRATRTRRAVRSNVGEPANTNEIFLALGATIRDKHLPPGLFEDLLSAFRQDVTVTRYASWMDVMDYCRRSANPVGRLVLRIADYRDGTLDGWSDAICTALQLTNFWQDLEDRFRPRPRLYSRG